jgi:hypothetical protein
LVKRDVHIGERRRDVERGIVISLESGDHWDAPHHAIGIGNNVDKAEILGV